MSHQAAWKPCSGSLKCWRKPGILTSGSSFTFSLLKTRWYRDAAGNTENSGFLSLIWLERRNPWPHVANHHISISQLLSSCCYIFTVSNLGLLSMQRPRPASHAHFLHSHIPELICGVNSSIDASCHQQGLVGSKTLLLTQSSSS